MSSILRSSQFVRYFAGLARGIIISNRQDIDRSLIQKSQHLAGAFSRFSLSSTDFRFNSPLENAIRQLDEGARKMGRISMKEIEEALNEIRHQRAVSASQSLMVIRCCGNLVPEEPPEQRTQLVEGIWKTFEKLGVSFDVSHYNALLKVYLENEHKFSPTEFLAKLEQQGVEPNRVTYQRLIAGYCQLGDIAGATKILEFMKEKQLPVSEGVFNALILGHSQADDMESAEGMLAVMRQANIEPSNETYCTLMCGYAVRGDSAAVERLITDCKVKDVLLSDKDFLDVAFKAAINGHDELVDVVLKNIRNMIGYNQDAANTLIRLITKDKDDAAFKVFLTMNPPIRSEGMPNMSGHLIIKQMVKSNRSAKHILSFSEQLEKEGHTKFGLSIALETSFHHGNVDLTLDLLRELRDKQEPVRNHYFWPSMMTLAKAGQSDRLIGILNTMVNEFNFSPNFETLADYYLPYVGDKSPRETVNSLLLIGVSRRQVVLAVLSRLISQNRLQEALDFALQHPGVNLRSMFLTRTLVETLQQTNSVKCVVKLLHTLTCNQSQVQDPDEEGESNDIPDRFIVGVASLNRTREKVAEVLQEMANLGLGISSSCAEAVEIRLPGNQLTTEISDLLAKLSSGDLVPVAQESTSAARVPPIRSAFALEKAKERIKSTNQNDPALLPVVRTLYNVYCDQGDIEKALKEKQEWVEELKQELTPGWWTVLMEAYCAKENLEGAKECWQKFKEINPELEVDSSKVLKLAKLYVQNNLIEETFTLLKEAKLRREGTFMARTTCWQVLHTAADTTKDPELVKKLLNILVDNGHTDVTNVLLGPIVKAHLLRDDMEGALKEFEECVNKYRATPFKNEITMRLIQMEDATKLQTLVDLSTQVHGEINSLYDLVLSFVECGRIRQARKILETPGLNSRTNRLHFACERYNKEGLAAPLEGLVEATKDLPHIDRSEIYYNLLDTYCKSDNVDKALGLWTQMQDEDVTVSDGFLVKLGNFLKLKGHDVPFVIPKQNVKVITESAKEQEPKTKRAENLLSAIRAMDVNEALKISSNLQNNGTQLSRTESSRLLELLAEKNRLNDGVNLLTSLPSDKLPNSRALNFFLNKLCYGGEIELLTKVGAVLSEDLRKITSYSNKYLTCAVAAGRAKEELEKLEREIDAATTLDEIDRLAQTFPRGGIFGVLESSPSYHEQVSVIAEKYFKKGFSAPINCLCMFHLANGDTEKAKEIYQKYNLANSSQLMFKNVLRSARRDTNPKLIEELISLVGNAVSLTPETKGLLYSNLINEYNKLGNFEIALSKLEEGLQSVPIEHIYPRTLTNLKEGLESKNIPFKYTIPEKVSKESSSSSSSSDAESKKTAAAKQ